MARKKPDDEQTTDSDDPTREALRRVLDHAERHGEVYDGASADHATLRELLGELASDESQG